MSTRATYQFSNTHLAGEDVTVYIHHDGYLQGAANYFRKAMDEKLDSGKPLLESFITANHAYITRSHEAHGDTDYRYSTDGKSVIIEKRVMCSDAPDQWVVLKNLGLDQFISAAEYVVAADIFSIEGNRS